MLLVFSFTILSISAVTILKLYHSKDNPYSGSPYIKPPDSQKLGNEGQWKGEYFNVVNKEFIPHSSNTAIMHYKHIMNKN